MKSSQFLVLILAFAVGMGVSFFLVYRLLNARLEERLQAIRSRMVDEDKPLAGRLEIWAREWLSKLVRFSMDEEKWENSPKFFNGSPTRSRRTFCVMSPTRRGFPTNLPMS